MSFPDLKSQREIDLESEGFWTRMGRVLNSIDFESAMTLLLPALFPILAAIGAVVLEGAAWQTALLVAWALSAMLYGFLGVFFLMAIVYPFALVQLIRDRAEWQLHLVMFLFGGYPLISGIIGFVIFVT